MKFTLTLHDYIQQYVKNRDSQQTHCPVCYEQVLCDNTKTNMAHMLECYKQQLLLQLLKQNAPNDPDSIDRIVTQATDQVCQEMITYFECHQSILDPD